MGTQRTREKRLPTLWPHTRLYETFVESFIARPAVDGLMPVLYGASYTSLMHDITSYRVRLANSETVPLCHDGSVTQYVTSTMQPLLLNMPEKLIPIHMRPANTTPFGREDHAVTLSVKDPNNFTDVPAFHYECKITGYDRVVVLSPAAVCRAAMLLSAAISSECGVIAVFDTTPGIVEGLVATLLKYHDKSVESPVVSYIPGAYKQFSADIAPYQYDPLPPASVAVMMRDSPYGVGDELRYSQFLARLLRSPHVGCVVVGGALASNQFDCQKAFRKVVNVVGTNRETCPFAFSLFSGDVAGGSVLLPMQGF